MDGPKLDVAPDIDFGGGETDGGDGCKKIDFLFVIDNSNSMANEQQLLIDAFPGFITAIESGLPQATDYHIGVTKSDIHGFDDNPDPIHKTRARTSSAASWTRPRRPMRRRVQALHATSRRALST